MYISRPRRKGAIDEGTRFKSKYTFADTELGDYLRKLANALDGEAMSEFSDLPDKLSNYSKLDLKIKRKNESVVMKLKAKLPATMAEQAISNENESQKEIRPKYKLPKKNEIRLQSPRRKYCC